MNAQEGREQRRGLRENCEPLDDNNDSILGVESQTFPLWPFLT